MSHGPLALAGIQYSIIHGEGRSCEVAQNHAAGQI